MDHFHINLRLGGVPDEFTGLGLIFFSDKVILQKRLMPGSTMRVVVPERMLLPKIPREEKSGNGAADRYKSWSFRIGLPGIIGDINDDEACIDEYNSRQFVLNGADCSMIEKREVKNLDRIVYQNLLGEELSDKEVVIVKRAAASRLCLFNPGFISRVGDFTLLPIDIQSLEVNSCGFCDETNTCLLSYESYFRVEIQELKSKISNKESEILKIEAQINANNEDADIKEITAEIESKNGIVEALNKSILDKTEKLNTLSSKCSEPQIPKNNVVIKNPRKGPPPVDF